MTIDVVCLRPAADFVRAGVNTPRSLNIAFRSPVDTDVADLTRDARAMVIPAVGPKLPAALFEGSHLQLVQVTGAGVDRLDQAALVRMRIPVANVPGGSNSAVAEYAVTAASSLMRRFGWADYEIHNGNYEASRARMLADNVQGIDGLLVGIVGLGTIGKAVARAFEAAGCRIAYYDPSPTANAHGELPQAQGMALDDLLRTADIVTLHLPLLASTRGLIDAAALNKMKPEAVLINASRGGIVDEIALADHLSQKRIAGAAVDVYSTEPPTRDNPLLTLSGEGARRLLLTPHIAGVTRQSAAFLFQEAWNNVDRVLAQHQPPLHRVY